MLELRPLTKTLGAEVCGVDLHQPQPAEVMAAIAEAWDRYAVLLFRAQELSPDDQVAFTSYFGEIHPTQNGLQRGNDVMHIGNVEVDGVPSGLPTGEMWFHQDGCYRPRPMRQTFLYGLKLPSSGGNTKFAGTERAYRALPAELRERILDYDIRFSYNYTLVREAASRPMESYVHPLVIVHPSTEEPLLFCNRLMADEIVGMAPDESRGLIERLCTELERPDNLYEHEWRLGDFIMWDNLATAHARTDFDPLEERLLRRTTTEGFGPRAFRDRFRLRPLLREVEEVVERPA